MIQRLDKSQAEHAKKDLENLTEEALSAKLRRKWYDLSAEGLCDAAKTVAEFGTPVITAVKAVLSLLSGITT